MTDRGMGERSRWRAWLAHPRLPWVLAGVALVIAAPSLFTGLCLDDWWHRIVLTHADFGAPGMPPTWKMFRAFDGRPEWTRWAIDHGIGAWWAEPTLRLNFLRPLTAMTHALDYALWPNAPWAMHAQSMLWFVACTVVGAFAYRRAFSTSATRATSATSTKSAAKPWVAGLAALLFTLDPTHGMDAGWIAQRNTLVSTVFGLAAWIAHDRARKDRSLGAAIASPLLLALGLAGSEGALGAVGYLVAYAAVLDEGSTWSRVRSLAPHAVVLCAWAIVYRTLGFGARGSAMYVDPSGSPARFALAVATRGPIELATEIGGPPPDLAIFLSARAKLFMLAVAIVALAFAAIALAPARRRPEVRFFALGAALAVIPVCGTTPASRVLYLVSFGGMGLVASMVDAVVEGTSRSIVARAWTYVTAGAHLLLGAPLFVFGSVGLFYVQRMGDRLGRDVPRDASIERLVVVNPPDCSFLGMLPLVGRLRGLPMPQRSLCLAPGGRAMQIDRVDERTLLVRAPGGFVQNEMDGLVRDPRDPLDVGARIELTHLTIEIASSPGGRPDAALFRFDTPLEDRSLRWMRWEGAHLVPFDLPAVGASTTIVPASLGL